MSCLTASDGGGAEAALSVARMEEQIPPLDIDRGEIGVAVAVQVGQQARLEKLVVRAEERPRLESVFAFVLGKTRVATDRDDVRKSIAVQVIA